MDLRCTRWASIIIAAVITVGSLITPFGVRAQQPNIQFIPEIPIFGFLNNVIDISSNSIGDYIRTVFVAFIWVVGILATVMVIYGGVKWVAAAGNAGRIKDARDIVDSAIIGVIIALTSVVLLNLINPGLTRFNGLVLTSVDKELADFVAEVQQAGANFIRCDKTLVSGEPSKMCSGPTDAGGSNDAVTYGCLNLNDRINQSNGYYGVDRFAVKAIVTIESPRDAEGNPFSGPEGNTRSDGTAGPGYGLGQFKASTLMEVLKAVNGGLPPGCRADEIYAPDRYHISQSCKAWLDKRKAGAFGAGKSGLDAQLDVITWYFGRQLNDKKCIKGNYLLAAAAYNQGLGGASDSFCNTDYLKDPDRKAAALKAATEYIRRFTKAYADACANGR
jgi:hypothetical protein